MTVSATLQAVQELTAETGYPPTQRMIAQRIGKACSTVHEHLEALEDAGLIERSSDPRRLIRLATAVTSRNCGHCGAPLGGRRADCRYCSDSHRALASKARRAA